MAGGTTTRYALGAGLLLASLAVTRPAPATTMYTVEVDTEDSLGASDFFDQSASDGSTISVAAPTSIGGVAANASTGINQLLATGDAGAPFSFGSYSASYIWEQTDPFSCPVGPCSYPFSFEFKAEGGVLAPGWTDDQVKAGWLVRVFLGTPADGGQFGNVRFVGGWENLGAGDLYTSSVTQTGATGAIVGGLGAAQEPTFNDPLRLDVEFSLPQGSYQIALFVEASASVFFDDIPGDTGPASSEIDVRQTYRFLGIPDLDSQGNPIAFTVGDGSFDWFAEVPEGTLPPLVIPEPQTALLLAFGLAVLACRRAARA